MNQVIKQKPKTFEEIRQQAENGVDFWSARDLQKVLGYSSWDKFKVVIQKAMQSCTKSQNSSSAHFSQLGKMVKIGLGVERYIPDYDYRLTRYACYLIVQNGDSSKPVIASGQTYFAIQTRRQELADDKTFQQLDENKKRMLLRKELKAHNKQLVETASRSGVETHLDFAIFQNHGYQGLYGGLSAKDIHKKKGLKKSQQILDYMGSSELAANLFRATQAEDKLRRENIKGKIKANKAHHQVGVKVRQTIKELGGTMPEDLPVPETSVKSLEKSCKKKLPNKKSTEDKKK